MATVNSARRNAHATSATALADVETDPIPEEVRVALMEVLADAGLPDTVLRALATPGGLDDLDEQARALIDETLERMLEDGQLWAHARDEVMAQWRRLLDPTMDPLDAELCGYEFLDMVRSSVLSPDDLADVVGAMISQAGQSAVPEALAMMRVLAVVGPEQVRPLATEAARRLVASGLTDPRWVRGLGRPRLGSCYGYADPFGAQETIALAFSYGRRTHVVVVLIDKDLGGGVKDCGVFADGQARGIRSAYARAARSVGVRLEIYQPEQAYAILARALSHDPCPATVGQVSHVREFLDLLRQRAALLARLTPVE